MQARYYDPVIGRFYSNDPVDVLEHLGNETGIQGFNRYLYVNNNPYKYTDPNGEALNLIMGGIGALVGGVSGAGDALGQVISTGEVGDTGSVVASTVLGAVTGPYSSLAKAGQIGAVGQAAIPATMNTIATPLKDVGAEIINETLKEQDEK